MILTNVVGTIYASKVFLKGIMRDPDRSPSYIVTIGSSSGLFGNRGQSVYSASKSALIGWTQSLAKEYANRGVRAHLVCPGLVEDTDMARESLDRLQVSSVTKDDIIRAIDYLIHSPSSNGIILPVGCFYFGNG
jgi:NAD(P)-dependent dehydrogenase (short-subunit alcohol dehydrogenase family)